MATAAVATAIGAMLLSACAPADSPEPGSDGQATGFDAVVEAAKKEG